MTTLPGGPRAAVVADELPLVRAGVTSVLGDQGIEVIGDSGSGREALRLVAGHAPDLVVVGRLIDFPVVEFYRRIRRVNGVPPLTLGLLPGPTEDVGQLVRLGMEGLVLRGASTDEISRAVKRVVSGERPVAATLLPGVAGAGTEIGADTVGLSGREREVLVHLADGLSNRAIAEALFVSEATVKSHLSHIYAKLGVRSRVEALGRAASLRLLG